MVPASQIVRLLITYRSLLVPELDVLNIKSELTTTSISSEYSFVTLDVRSKDDEQIVCRIRLELNSKGVNVSEVYCSDRSIQETLSTNLKKKNFPGFDDKNLEPHTWTDEIRNYIEQADEVAGSAWNCVKGDGYRPGNFSAITIYEDHLELSQVNHMNAKSLDHKEDYSLRSLVFQIPLSKDFVKRVSNYTIGDMQVIFSDRSSQNNRRCGDKIQKALEEISKK